jgi:hypothetical protein
MRPIQQACGCTANFNIHGETMQKSLADLIAEGPPDHYTDRFLDLTVHRFRVTGIDYDTRRPRLAFFSNRRAAERIGWLEAEISEGPWLT